MTPLHKSGRGKADLVKRLGQLCIDAVFPRRCPFCDTVLGFGGPCTACEAALRPLRRTPAAPATQNRRRRRLLSAVYAPYVYKPPVRDAILRLKFAGRTDLARPLAAQQAEFLRDAGRAEKIDALVPVPSGKRERRGRGYDVPLLLARAIGRELGIPVLPALEKLRETPRQATLPGNARRSNLRGAFAVRANVCVAGLRLAVVDDVCTTGSTLRECAKALRAAGAVECIGVCIAVTR